MTFQHYHWYAAKFNVFANNFVVYLAILMRVGPLDLQKPGGSSFVNRNRKLSIPIMQRVLADE